jgi:hypothetical protein
VLGFLLFVLHLLLSVEGHFIPQIEGQSIPHPKVALAIW